MIPLHEQPVEELRQRDLRKWLIDGHSKLATQIVDGKISLLEVSFVNLAVEADVFPNKESSAMATRDKIVRYKHFLDVLKELREQNDFNIVVAANQ